MKTVTLGFLAKAAGAEVISPIERWEELPIVKVVQDSRKAAEGELFVCIRGERFDGHDFAGQVLSKGIPCVCEKSSALYREARDGKPMATILFVEDSILALGAMAKAYRQCFDPAVIAVTGSVGKTSCKDTLAAALGGGLRTMKTQGNLNNAIGLPFTLFELDEGVQAAIIEMGMNHFGEIDYLASLTEPEIGVITNIGTAHIEFLGSREGILQAKTELIPHLTGQKLLLLNGDDDLLYGLKEREDLLQRGITVRYFGKESRNDCKALSYRWNREGQLEVCAEIEGERVQLSMKTLGAHMVYYMLASLLAGRFLGLSFEQIRKGLLSFEPSPHRLAPVTTPDYLLIDDTYNANPDSMKSAIDTLLRMNAEGRRVAMLGDMLELGDYAKEAHFEVGAYAAAEGVDVIIAVGDEARQIKEGASAGTSARPGTSAHVEVPISGSASGPEVYYFRTRQEAEEKLCTILRKNDIILFKASHAMGFEHTVSLLKEASHAAD